MKRVVSSVLGLLACGLLAAGCVEHRSLTPEQATRARDLRTELRSATGGLPVRVSLAPDDRLLVEVEGVYTAEQIEVVRGVIRSSPSVPPSPPVQLLVYQTHVDEPVQDVNGVQTTRLRPLGIYVDEVLKR